MGSILKFLKNHIIFILIITSILLIRFFVLSVELVVGSSMNPTLNDGDLVVTDRQIFKIKGLDRFDIVVFDKSELGPIEGDPYYLVKRIVGLPGETIEMKDGILIIDGNVVEVPENVEKLNSITSDFGPVTIPENSYYVLGDNRYPGNSLDSRSGKLGFVTEDELFGVVYFRTKPKSDIGIVE